MYTGGMYTTQLAIEDIAPGHFTLYSSGAVGQLLLPGVVEYIKEACRVTYARGQYWPKVFATAHNRYCYQRRN